MVTTLSEHSCRLAELSYLSNGDILKLYESRPYNKQNKCFLSCESKPVFLESDICAQCFITIYEGSLLISFRGTESFRDFLTDANMIRVQMDLPNISKNKRPLVHWGFLRQFRSIEKQITPYINDYVNKYLEKSNFIIVGHSLGAALSSIAALQYGCEYNRKIKCVTFGSPRVGNTRFTKMFSNVVEHSERYVNQEDPIPGVPVAIRYKHVKGLRYIDTNGKINKTYTENRLWNFIKGVFMILLGGDKPSEDHSCDKYYKSICKCCDEQ